MSDSKERYYELCVTLEGEQALGEGQETHHIFVKTDYDLTLRDDKALSIVDDACWSWGDCGELMVNREDYVGYESHKTLAGYEIIEGPSEEFDFVGS